MTPSSIGLAGLTTAILLALSGGAAMAQQPLPWSPWNPPCPMGGAIFSQGDCVRIVDGIGGTITELQEFQRLPKPYFETLPAAPQTYTLITVTNGGDVHHSDGWATLDLCRDAESVAWTGMTVAAKKKADADAKAASDKRDAEWLAKHPPRAPKDAEERWIAGGNSGIAWYGGGGGVWACGDRQVCDEPPSFSGTIYIPSFGDIKYAECVIVPGER